VRNANHQKTGDYCAYTFDQVHSVRIVIGKFCRFRTLFRKRDLTYAATASTNVESDSADHCREIRYAKNKLRLSPLLVVKVMTSYFRPVYDSRLWLIGFEPGKFLARYAYSDATPLFASDAVIGMAR